MFKHYFKKYGIWIAASLFVLLIAGTAGWYFRVDLTAEKRYTLSPSTRQLLQELDTTIHIRVFLTGDLPANDKKLSVATAELLDEFKSIAGKHIKVDFSLPDDAGLSD